MREAVYPLYVLEKDDWSFREVPDYRQLDYYEWPDIIDGLYEGWDSSGRRFSLLWDERRKVRVVAFADERPDLQSFAEAIDELERRYADYKGRLPPTYLEAEYLRQRLDEIAGAK